MIFHTISISPHHYKGTILGMSIGYQYFGRVRLINSLANFLHFHCPDSIKMSKICLAMAFILGFGTLGVIELNGRITPQHSNETIGDKNWWITISGISKRLLQKPSPSGISEKLYDSEIAVNTQDSMTYNQKGTFCVDVSTFGEVEYKDVKIEVCDSTFTKQCTDQYKEVNSNFQTYFIIYREVIEFPFTCILNYSKMYLGLRQRYRN